MCRLCLYSTSDYFEFAHAHGHDSDKILDKIQKFLYLQVLLINSVPANRFQSIHSIFHFQISDDDPYPRTICQKCLNRLQQFNEFYLEVLQNQEILRYNLPLIAGNGGEPQLYTITTDLSDGKVSSAITTTAAVPAAVPTTTSNLIQVTPGFNFKADGSGSYILTLQTSGVGSMALAQETPTTMDLQQFISSNAMHSIESTPSIASATDSPIPDLNSLKSRSIALDASEMTRYTFDSQNQTSAFYTIGSKVSATSTAAAHSAKRPTDEQYAVRLKRGTKVASKLSERNFKQEPENVILKIERELDSSQDDERAAVDSDDNIDDECNADAVDDIDMNDIEVIDEIDIEDDRFNGFPKLIIKDAKLVIRGRQLVELMSKFYRLECDLCEDSK